MAYCTQTDSVRTHNTENSRRKEGRIEVKYASTILAHGIALRHQREQEIMGSLKKKKKKEMEKKKPFIFYI